MTNQKKALAGLMAFAVIAVGVVAYNSTAFGGKDCGASATKASASECTAGKAETTSASGEKAGCCASKGVSQASATTNATVVPVGAGASCGMKSEGASQAGKSCSMGASQASAGACSKEMAECGGCDLYKSYWQSLEKAGFEMKTVANGIEIKLTSDDPAVLAELVKYSNAKVAMYKGLKAGEALKGCSFCQEKATLMKDASFAVVSDAHSVKTVVTSATPTTVEGLHKIAATQQPATDVSSAKVEG
ncbi:MAG: hypothetical protein ACKVU1_00295 [bacterium]